MTRLSKPGLAKMHRVLSGYVERKEMPGLCALVSCGPDLHFETLGTLALDSPAPMRRDSIFRIASLAKLVTAVCAMILLEECTLRLDDSIETWLPELANRRVLKTIASEPDDTVPATRSITVRDLLTYRMGFGSVMARAGTYPIQKLIRDNKIGGHGPPRPALALPTDEWIAKLGSLPWMAQPGEKWLYHTSGDVLGLLVARVAGVSLGEFMRQRIFDPLGMKDTAFHVPDQKLDRLTAAYGYNHKSVALEIYDGVADTLWRGQPPFESGGGGLVSTIDDYFAFSRMMLGMGRLGSEVILSRTSVALMTSDRISPQQRAGSETFFGFFSSWGLGMAVDTGREEIFHSPGRYGWTGGLGTTAYNDPANNAIGILFTQRMMDSPKGPTVFSDFWTLAYAAME